MPDISVIIPVYNTRAYLDECVASVARQTSALSVEILLVDDGSTDGSGEVCDSMHTRYPGVRVFHIPNGGVSHARNTGLELALGRYVAFLDSDDTWQEGFLEALGPAMEDEPDMVQISGRFVSPEGVETPISVMPLDCDVSGKAYLMAMTQHSLPAPRGVWVYVWRRKFLFRERLEFDETLTIGEDMVMNLRGLDSACLVRPCPGAVYRYRQQETSAMHTLSASRWLSFIRSEEACFHILPSAYFAHAFATRVLLALSALAREDSGEISTLSENSGEIWLACTEKPYRVAYRLMKLFDPWVGTKVYYAIVNVKNLPKTILSGGEKETERG